MPDEVAWIWSQVEETHNNCTEILNGHRLEIKPFEIKHLSMRLCLQIQHLINRFGLWIYGVISFCYMQELFWLKLFLIFFGIFPTFFHFSLNFPCFPENDIGNLWKQRTFAKRYWETRAGFIHNTKRHIVNYVGARSLYSRMLNVCVVCLPYVWEILSNQRRQERNSSKSHLFFRWIC